MADKPQDPQALTALALLQTYPGAGAQAETLVPKLFEDLVTLRSAVIAADWDDVFAAATNCLGRAAAAFLRLQGESYVDAVRIEQHQGIVVKMREVIEQIVAQGDATEWVGAIREQLEDSPEVLAAIESDLKAIEQGNAVTIGLMHEVLSIGSGEGPLLRESLGQAIIAGLTRGLLGLVHAELNRGLKRISVPNEGWPGISAAFQYQTTQFAEDLRQRQIGIYNALGTKPPKESIEQVAALTRFLEHALPPFARGQARVRLAIQALLADDNHSAAKELGQLALRAGGLTREAIASQAAGYHLAFELIDPTSAGGQLATLARSVPFDKPLPTPPSTPLAEVGETEDATDIEIEGFVQQMRVERSSDGKLLGQVTLVDPADGATASAAIVFVHPLHAGITVGAFFSVSGTFRTSSKLHNGMPAVEANRLSLSRRAKQAWRIAFLHSATPFYENWRNQTHMYWSLGPHEEVATDADPVQGAGELIYTPFIRSH